MHSPTISLTSALDGDGWSASRPGRFTSGKDPLPIVQETGWAPGPIWTDAENLAPTGIRSPDRQVRSKLLHRLSYHGHHLHFLLCIHSARTACPKFLNYISHSNTYRKTNNTTILLHPPICLSVNKIYSIRILLALHYLQIDLLLEKVIHCFPTQRLLQVPTALKSKSSTCSRAAYMLGMKPLQTQSRHISLGIIKQSVIV